MPTHKVQQEERNNKCITYNNKQNKLTIQMLQHS